jgi:hypothetical protein
MAAAVTRILRILVSHVSTVFGYPVDMYPISLHGENGHTLILPIFSGNIQLRSDSTQIPLYAEQITLYGHATGQIFIYPDALSPSFSPCRRFRRPCRNGSSSWIINQATNFWDKPGMAASGTGQRQQVRRQLRANSKHSEHAKGRVFQQSRPYAAI